MTAFSKNIVITGGLGYVGGRLANYLAGTSPELRLRLLTRRAKKNLPEWARQFDVLQTPTLEENHLNEAVEGADTVIHLAAANEIVCHRDPELAIEINATGTLRLLEACRKKGVGRFIYMSTFHVYGATSIGVITEDVATSPIHPYAITHRVAEDLVNSYRVNHGMTTLSLRLSNGYGYPADPEIDRWTLVFNDFCRQAISAGHIKLASKGTQFRDFQSMTDVGRGVHHFLSMPDDEWKDGLFNFGGDCSMSIIQAAERVATEFHAYSGRKIPVLTGTSEDRRGANPVVFSIDKLKKTGFTPIGNMSEEIQKTFIVAEGIPD